MNVTLDDLISGKLLSAKQVKMSCDLISFPRELFSLADSLEILDLSKNNLSELPEDFYKFRKLKILFLSENHFTVFPKILSKCLNLDIIGFKANNISTVEEGSFPPNLRWLILTNNKISNLPLSIGNCSKLQKCMLAGNNLTTLPDEMSNCKNLELLRIAANQITVLPEWLFRLPKLAWIAFAGNTNDVHLSELANVKKFNTNEFKIGRQLGEGASGNIFEASRENADKPEVAIKYFKGEVTSDGYPKDEMYAAVSAGHHPNIIKVLGIIDDLDDNQQVLIFEKISDSYKKLGFPPNFKTCTRDVYPSELKFTSNEVLKIAVDISKALKHLHSQGILHGDLYAHNILIDYENLHCILGDFGAASLYDKNTSIKNNVERIEVRAFGCLLEELLERVVLDDGHLENLDLIKAIKNECLQIDLNVRPSFFEIVNRISS